MRTKLLLLTVLALATACSSSATHLESSGRATLAAAPETELPKWDGGPKSIEKSRYRPVVGLKGMVVSDDQEASEWGVEILRKGGNAVDAAVATGFALAVTRPHYASIGGGGFLVFCPAPRDGKARACQTIDYREQAPARASRDMYLQNGKANTDLSSDGALASGVPGVTAGLLTALERFGKLPRQKLLTRPIQLAKRGFRFTAVEESGAAERWEAMNESAKKIFGCQNAPCRPGTVIRQPELARVLTEISARGIPGFYQGWVAKKIAEGFRKAGGILNDSDLASYRVMLREPVRGEFKGHEVISMAPPSAGGTLLIQMLNYITLAEKRNELKPSYGSAANLHVLSHAMALAFADRAQHFGDPDQVSVPVEKLIAPDYQMKRWGSTFVPGKAAIPSGAGELGIEKGTHTTHFSVIDGEGNAVSVTTTVNDNFGSGFVPPGTGVVMNDQMDDFSAQPGTPNMYGLVGAEANSIAPHKRPLSSMSPTIVRDGQGRVELVLGAQGGPRITTAVFLALVNRLFYQMSLPDAVHLPRIHEQWKPQEIQYETAAISPEAVERLKAMGYALKLMTSSGRIAALERFADGRVWGVSDLRTEGAAIAE